MPNNKIRAVIFDMDGTLLNTLPDLEHCINSVLQNHGLPTHTQDAIRSFVGSGLTVAVGRALVAGGTHTTGTLDEELTHSLASEIRTVYAANPSGHTEFYDGMTDLLDALETRGVNASILSNKPDHLVQMIAQDMLDRWEFDRVLGQVDGEPLKPDPRAALGQAEAMGVRPDEVLFLGDSGVDIETARNAGMFAVGAAWGFRGEAELTAAGADAVVDHPSEVMTLITG